MRILLIVAALGEAATGFFLLARPRIAIRLLLGMTIAGAADEMSRVAGITLIALGVACWPDSNTQRGFYGMLTYSTIVMLFLVFVGIRIQSASCTEISTERNTIGESPASL